MTEHWNCLSLDLIILNVALAFINGVLASVAFAQFMRIHTRSQQDGWTRQKVLHLMVGFSNLGYFIYFISTIIATCNGWHCWTNTCGFILMASPKILFLAVFLLLLSFWVDLCHQANEEEEEDNDENSIQQVLLEVRKSGSSHVRNQWRCCSFQCVQVGTRQKYVIMIVVFVFVMMMSFAVMICIGGAENPINPSVVAQVYQKLLAGMTLILAAALGCYSFFLFFRLKKVRSEKASSEMWKLFNLWHLRIIYGVKALVLLIFYYFVGCSLPSAYLLWIIRELPPPITDDYRQEQPRAFTFISHENSNTNQPGYWATATCSTNQVFLML
ncbi:tobamovirus multiplication protein 1 isoform X1 [Senna tora]|uniref:Tobamovirus multiplication protein 1 isoform X1 n=1 Tax=Senna tora TaxID=362788 RepID=A0A835C698_9FABA|nr:tobamovirus multiplication protein 1 isoform X1 [Senna tora]